MSMSSKFARACRAAVVVGLSFGASIAPLVSSTSRTASAWASPQQVGAGRFQRTDVDALVPTLIAYPDRVERVDGSIVKPAPLGNSLKIAFDLAQSDAGEVIGVVGATRGVTIGDGKSIYYQDSVNKPGGVRGIAIVGLTSDATINGSLIFQNRQGASDVNGDLCFARLTIKASEFTYGVLQTFMGNRPTERLEFVEDVLVPTRNTYSHARFQGRASCSFRLVVFAMRPDGKPIKEHGVYGDNWCGDSEVVDCEFDHTGRCAVQLTNRIESGPPQVGTFLIQGNEIAQPLDAFAITVAGQSDPLGAVLIVGNRIQIDGDVDGDGVHDWDVDSTAGGIVCYREGANVDLPIPKLGAWPVGSTGSEGYSVSNLPSPVLPCLNRVVLRGNRIVGFDLKKQLVAIGSCKTLRVGDGSLFQSNNRPALEINHQGKVHEVVLTFGSGYRGWRASKKIVDRTNPAGVELTDAQIDALMEVGGVAK